MPRPLQLTHDFFADRAAYPILIGAGGGKIFEADYSYPVDRFRFRTREGQSQYQAKPGPATAHAVRIS